MGQKLQNIVNTEYLNLYKEVPLFFLLSLSRRRANGEEGRILIVCPSLIGEFAAALPAIRDFIERHQDHTVEIMVAPPLVPLARRIRGIGEVFSARSVYGRDEAGGLPAPVFPAYEKIVVLRMSGDAYRTVRQIPAAQLESAGRDFVRYGCHLVKSLWMRRTPIQWSEFNFMLLGSDPRPVPFEELFDFSPAESEAIRSLPALQGNRRKIVVHTYTPWAMKRWEREKWIATLKKIHAIEETDFIFVGRRQEKIEAAEIAAALDFKTYSLAGELSLAELVLLLRHSHFFIGIDSGPANLAHLVGLKSIVILGPGPHMYLPPHDDGIAIDKTGGRGLMQMFFSTRNGFIDRTQPDEVVDAFRQLSAPELTVHYTH